MKPDPAPGQSVLIDRRKFALGLAFAAAAGVAAARQPTERIDYLGKRKLEDLIPLQVGDWKFMTASGLVVPPEDQLARLLYTQQLTRVYSDGDKFPVMMLIAQSAQQTGLLQVHRPEVCYPVGGFALTPVIERSIDLGGRNFTLNALGATKDGRTEHILYWTRIADQVPLGWAQQRWAVARENLLGRVPDAALVRLSSLEPNQELAFAQLSGFIRTLLAGLDDSSRRVLIP